MKERPILFSGEMVRAILDGRKTQTRRLVRRPERLPADVPFNVTPCALSCGFGVPFVGDGWGTNGHYPTPCPYGQPGDLLWVRETWGLHLYGDFTCWHRDSVAGRTADDLLLSWEVAYAADALSPYDHWRPSIHMPRWASRITLRVTNVRAQRLQDISEDDARAEGLAEERDEWWSAYDPETKSSPEFFADPTGMRGMRLESIRKHERVTTAADNFRALWNRLNGARSPWSANPWVWAVSFERVKS